MARVRIDGTGRNRWPYTHSYGSRFGVRMQPLQRRSRLVQMSIGTLKKVYSKKVTIGPNAKHNRAVR